MHDQRTPSIAGIQRTNAIIVIVVAMLLLSFDSAKAAVSCAVGGTVMIANLFVLAVVGKAMLGLARGGGGFRARLAALIFPIKLLLLGGLVYLIFASVPVDGIGFVAGVLTQLAAIIIETARVSHRGVQVEIAMES